LDKIGQKIEELIFALIETWWDGVSYKEHQQVEQTVNKLIKTWWEDGPSTQLVIKNKETTLKLKQILQSFVNNDQKSLERITALEKSIKELISFVNNDQKSLERITALEKSIKEIIPFVNNMNNELISIDDVRDLISEETESLVRENEILMKDIEQLKRQLRIEQTTKPDVSPSVSKTNNQKSSASSSFDQIIEEFNAWAKNPSIRLPSKFYYAEGDMKLRKNCMLEVSSSSDATWIVNRNGTSKYLFPNPNVIDQLGGKIDVLYKINGNRRAKGQNRVNIQKACNIVDDGNGCGWVEYRGELNLI
jgi:regulator of replication initiation timing